MEKIVDWNLISGVSSAIIALCALGLTIQQTRISQRHNKLSVQPHLTTWIHSDHSSHFYTVDLLNNGIGPAFIKEFKILIDGQPLTGEGTEPIEKALKVLFPNYQYTSRQAFVDAGYSMAVNETRQVAIVKFEGINLPTPEEVEQSIKRASLLITYTSIYDEIFKLDSNSLKSNPSY